MIANPREELTVLPPPGPLQWVFPELVVVERTMRKWEKRTRGQGGAIPAERVLDLALVPLRGEALVEALKHRNPSRIKVPAGGRGDSLYRFLSQETPFGPITERLRSCKSLVLEGMLPKVAAWNRRRVIELPDQLREPGIPSCFAVLQNCSGTEVTHWKRELRELFRQRRMAADERKYAIPLFVPCDHSRELLAEPGQSSSEARELHAEVSTSWWGLLPGSVIQRSARKTYLSLLRYLAPSRVQLYGALENLALAGVDLVYDSLACKFREDSARIEDINRAPSISRRDRGRVIAVCGIDGSGKTTHVTGLYEYLRSSELRVGRYKMFRHGTFHELVTNLVKNCVRDRNLQLWQAERLIKVYDSLRYFYEYVEKDLDNLDVLLFDRYIYTHLAAGFGRCGYDSHALRLLRLYPRPAHVFLLDVPPESSMANIEEREDKTLDENLEMLARYRAMLLSMASFENFTVLDGTESYETNQAIIQSVVDALLLDR